MANLKAMKELRANVADLIWDPDLVHSIPEFHTDLTWKSYNGSLDAAKALHEAVLPVTRFDLAQDEAEDFGSSTKYNPARAWLLAILDALIEKEQSDG